MTAETLKDIDGAALGIVIKLIENDAASKAPPGKVQLGGPDLSKYNLKVSSYLSAQLVFSFLFYFALFSVLLPLLLTNTKILTVWSECAREQSIEFPTCGAYTGAPCYVS